MHGIVEVLEGGKMPTKAHATDAGFDLYLPEDVTIRYGEVFKIPLNIKMALPEGTYAEITTKSGLGSKGMLVFSGIVDSGYRGTPHVVCTCIRLNTEIELKKGSKIAQMIIHPFSLNYTLIEGKVSEDTDRGTGGFGSTGQ